MTQSPWDVAGWAAESLGPESAALADLDMAQFGEALGLAVKGLAVHPLDVAVVSARFAAGLAQLPAAALARWIGLDRVPTFEIDPRDRRFADPAWSDNPAFYSLRQYFLAASQLTGQLISDAGLRPMTERKARLAAGLILDLLAPTNFLLTNPAALKRAFDTGGASVLKGVRNVVDDVLHNNGRPRQVDTTPFTIGENLAATACEQGGVSQRTDGATSVRAADQTGPRCAVAVQSSMDQQVLRDLLK